MKSNNNCSSRQIAIFLSALLAVSFLAGCEKEESQNNTKKSLSDDSSSSSSQDDSSSSAENLNNSHNNTIDNVDAMASTGEVYSQTIMVYMVGSDLESKYGNASLDMQEMQKAMPDTENNNIIVYAGGASEWKTSNLDADKNTILKLEKDGFSEVSSTDVKNMGEAETLSEFINYGLTNYDTDKYSLILWNHGAGPVFGFGVDENYEDLLSLQEMQSALNDSIGKQEKKLEWIGFDACLMSSLEVADVFAPYANYLISSQETEPGWGWNYEFLSKLSEPDMDGARLGKEIIDSYMKFGEEIFEISPKYYSDLTLSCVDLNKYQAAEDELNTFFSQMDSSLDSSTFPSAVRNRDNAKDFGTYSSDFNYSLVDTSNLLQLLSEDSSVSADSAISAIDDMIVYMRTNVENAGGISICYPYQTDEKYAEYCISLQEYLNFAPGYTNFLKTFNSIKDGDTILEPENLDIADAETNVEPISSDNLENDTSESDSSEPELSENIEPSEESSSIPDNNSTIMTTGGSDISLALTPEQQQNFGTASFYILCKTSSSDMDLEMERLDEAYTFIHGGKNVKMDENGVLHAYYSDNVVYLKDTETGELSPTPMVLIDNDSSSTEKRYLTFVVLTKVGESISDWDTQSAQLQIVVNDEYPNGIIRSAIPTSNEDDEIQRASKQLLDLSDYTYLASTGRVSYLTRDEDGKMMDFWSWENSGTQIGIEQDLTTGYELEVCPIQNPENYFCMFVVRDAQGNSTVSELIPLG